ncbi:Uncharacterised protein [Orientia tsutsugamushi]|uniref:Uncharacterized protein n=1 Tax=Orientia tsutsugamushi TaxID=784 RepID=A0A2R8F0E0_ORITS|nr:Uncharacterised protein [Orientia tsutsugamushi]SPM46448.1 Uncharacterised protein [Orientia tsutsugamushi]
MYERIQGLTISTCSCFINAQIFIAKHQAYGNTYM